MGHAEFWSLKDREIILAYMFSNPAEREVKHFHYIFPKHEEQIVISRNYYQKAPNVVCEMLKRTGITKYLTPHVILNLNKILYQNGGWGALYKLDRGRTHNYFEKVGMLYLHRNAFIVQSISNNIGLNAVKNGLYESIWNF